MSKFAGHDLGIPVGGVRPGYGRLLRWLAIAVLAIGLDVAVVTYRIETRAVEDPRVSDVMRSAARAHKRQMGMLYGTTAADLMAWAGNLDKPGGHAALIAIASAIASLFCFRLAHLSGSE
jgi:hypothetical protein